MNHLVHDVGAWPEHEEEQLGSKPKTWLRHPDSPDGPRWLWKCPRPATGEHWAEVVAADIAAMLGIPHAVVQLARRGAMLGTISRDFTAGREGHAILWHGNQLLATSIHGYARDAQKPPLHTVDAVLDYLSHPGIHRPAGLVQLPGVTAASDAFVGYLMLDALIGNTDRHHENWGLLQVSRSAAPGESTNHSSVELAPSYDHASSLGRDLTDDARRRRVTGSDPRVTVAHYCARGRTPLYGARFDASRGTYEASTQLTFREAFEHAIDLMPQVGGVWLRHLAACEASQLMEPVERVPAVAASTDARAFARAVLACNREFLLSLLP